MSEVSQIASLAIFVIYTKLKNNQARSWVCCVMFSRAMEQRGAQNYLWEGAEGYSSCFIEMWKPLCVKHTLLWPSGESGVWVLTSQEQRCGTTALLSNTPSGKGIIQWQFGYQWGCSYPFTFGVASRWWSSGLLSFGNTSSGFVLTFFQLEHLTFILEWTINIRK